MALGALSFVFAVDESLELMMALLADVFVYGHGELLKWLQCSPNRSSEDDVLRSNQEIDATPGKRKNSIVPAVPLAQNAVAADGMRTAGFLTLLRRQVRTRNPVVPA